jgi:hypothetical protein
MPELKNYDSVIEEWIIKGNDAETAKTVTIEQVDALIEICSIDEKWKKLLEIFRSGRIHDSWLAANWPVGFDELILCAPLCKLVDWECAKCHVGMRQNNFSCANDDSLFGYIAVLLAVEKRELLLKHLAKIKLVLENENIYWDITRHEIEIKTGTSY